MAISTGKQIIIRPDLEAALARVERGEGGAAEAETLRAALALAEMKIIKAESRVKELGGKLRIYQLEADEPLEGLPDG